MASTPPVYDGLQTLELGVDSGRSPSRIGANQVAFAWNATMRGDFIHQRPLFRKLPLTFEDATVSNDFRNGWFQGASFYQGRSDRSQIIAHIGGKLFRVDIATGKVIALQLPSGHVRSTNQPHAWFCQAEEFMVIQDGQQRALIYNGGSLTEASGDGVPCGTAMAYGNGRLWVALPDGYSFTAGDLIYGDSGTVQYGYRDSVLHWTENTFLAEGGNFTVPAATGPIQAMRFIAQTNTSLGQGPLQVFTSSGGYSVNVPFDRTAWKEVTWPIQTASLLGVGGVSQESTVAVNNDMWFRSRDGMRSFALSVRQEGEWASTPMSREMDRVFLRDTDYLLSQSSAALFDNRLLVTSSPVLTYGHGTYHRCLTVLNFDNVSSMYDKKAPAWEGIWTGLKFLNVITGMVNGTQRCFAFALSAAKEIEVWEITKEDGRDRSDDTEYDIAWGFETRSMLFPDGGQRLKMLAMGDIWIDELAGRCWFDVDYKPDQAPCWYDWHKWSICSYDRQCDPGDGSCLELVEFRPQYRPQMRLPEPPDECEESTKKPISFGYEFQARVSVTGRCRIKQMRLIAENQPMEEVGDCLADANCEASTCCQPSPFEYSSEGFTGVAGNDFTVGAGGSVGEGGGSGGGTGGVNPPTGGGGTGGGGTGDPELPPTGPGGGDGNYPNCQSFTGGGIISLTPSPISRDTSQSVTMSVVAGNGTAPYTYQWYLFGDTNTPLVDGANVIGSTTKDLLLMNLTTDNSGLYFVVVTDANGCTCTSNGIDLTVSVIEPPHEGCYGNNAPLQLECFDNDSDEVTFCVKSSGFVLQDYEWGTNAGVDQLLDEIDQYITVYGGTVLTPEEIGYMHDTVDSLKVGGEFETYNQLDCYSAGGASYMPTMEGGGVGSYCYFLVGVQRIGSQLIRKIKLAFVRVVT